MARNAINVAIKRLDSMPLVLRLVCLASLCVGLAMLVISILQIGSIRIFDDTLSWGQVRTAGYYPFLVISALVMTVAGIGIWMERGWSRWLVVLLYVIPSPMVTIYWRNHSQVNHGSSVGYCVSAALWAAFFYWYLFHRQKNAFD